MISLTIKSLLEKVNSALYYFKTLLTYFKIYFKKINLEQRDALFAITKVWFEDEERSLHKRIASQLTRQFVEIEKQQFERRLPELVPILLHNLNKKSVEEVNETESERFVDQYLVNLLNLVIKILSECKVLNTNEWQNYMNQIYGNISKHTNSIRIILNNLHFKRRSQRLFDS